MALIKACHSDRRNWDLLKEFGDQARPIYWAGFTLVGGIDRNLQVRNSGLPLHSVTIETKKGLAAVPISWALVLTCGWRIIN
jgi:hypothetical protein